MKNFNETELLLNIQQLIDKQRCSIDGFFTDSRTAAKDILNYMQSEMISKNDVAVEMRFTERSKAA